MPTTSPTAPPMSRPRLIFATLLALVAPGTGIGLVSDGYEGFSLYLIYRIFTPGIYKMMTSPVIQNHPLSEWVKAMIALLLFWGGWVFIDVGNVIYRAKAKETLPEPQGPYPLPLLWLARCFILIGLALIPAIYMFQPNYTQRLLWPLAFVGPFFIVIADRLLRRRSGWRIITISLLAVSLAIPLYAVFRIVSGATTYQSNSPIGWLIFAAQIAFILGALVILFLPSTRSFFRKPASQPEVITP